MCGGWGCTLKQLHSLQVELLVRVRNFKCDFINIIMPISLKEMTTEKKRADDLKQWETWLEKYLSRLAQEAEGVSDTEAANGERVRVMNSVNPR